MVQDINRQMGLSYEQAGHQHTWQQGRPQAQQKLHQAMPIGQAAAPHLSPDNGQESGYQTQAWRPLPNAHSAHTAASHQGVPFNPPRLAPQMPRKQVPLASLNDYNQQLSALQADINASMNVVQRNGARVLNVIGTVAAVGGAVTVGILGMTAFASAATGVGLPVAAVAALAGAAVGLAGLLLTQLTTAGLRSLLRRSVKHKPQLAARLDAMRTIRDVLVTKPTLSREEKLLLKNIRTVLGKVEGAGASIKAQAKTSGKTLLGTGGAAIALALSAMVENPWAMIFSGGGGGGLDLSDPAEMKGLSATPIDLNDQNQNFLALGKQP